MLKRQHGATLIEDLGTAVDWDDLITQETIAMKAEFKLNTNAYLADLVYSPVRTLAQVT
jgi:hypothetical protein